MSGMPAFGERLGPEELVAIAAFVSALPGLSPEDYAALAGSAPEVAQPVSSPAALEPQGGAGETTPG